MRVVAIVNQKGGCGKTTTAINLAGVLAKRSLRTLLVDTDPQGHCAAGLAIPEQRIDLHIGDAMLAGEGDGLDTARLLWRVSRNLDLAPSTMRLAGLESPRGGLASRPEPEKALKIALRRFRESYDVCLIDCSPSIGLLTYNALAAADEVLIPVETGFFSLQGAVKQINTIKSLGKRLGGNSGDTGGGGGGGGGTPPLHLLATMHDESSVLATDLLEELRKRFGARVVPTVIRWDARLKEAASFGQPVIEYAPTSPGAADYSALADWLIDERLGVEVQPEPAEWDVPRTSFGFGIPPTPRLTETMQPEVCVVPGVADRVIEPKSAPPLGPPALPAVVPPPPIPKPVFAPVTVPTVEPVTEMPPIPASRAADMVARARRLHRPEAEPSTLDASMTPAHQQAPAHAEAPAFGVRTTREGTWFRQPSSIGASIFVSGDFNNWSDRSSPLELSAAGDAWEIRLPLKSGVYQYRLLVDGQWMPDPHNPLRVPNPFGGSNSLLAVPEVGQDRPSSGKTE